MPEFKRYSLLTDLMVELAPEIEAAQKASASLDQDEIHPVQPALSAILSEFAPLPREALFLGVAALDGLPVLLNLMDPVPGPILIVGDAGSGKTAFLQMIASGVEQIHEPQDVQYGVITAHLDDWKNLGGTPNCVDVFPSYKNSAQDFLNSLASWAHSNRGEKQSLLLLIDDLAEITKMDFEARQSLRWLLLRGPARHVWPIVTLNPRNINDILPWTEFFHTRLFGRMKDSQDIQSMTGTQDSLFTSLIPRLEFLMREGRQWLKFWIPSLD